MPTYKAFDREAYHIDGKTDLQVEREQAIARQRGGSKYGAKPEGTLLHFHPKLDDRTECTKYHHELYEVGRDGAQVIPSNWTPWSEQTASHTEG